ncbi:histone-lysine N-methyltransferase SETMAR-like [Mizuhopecten yessoensis]|uniref:Histone-lysine N-methyltransferase SETMAR n=1 Tax=Mizuhopecten yessoensis TaxID=6573 RepID=A0A210PS17_MIZYE|nr:histone-lysine N-methyltransferase SETMAR-like [Mizuhopecten yessoensis]OWF39297.1 Histone-lysine N-methyltransferase SETMAR [Mizuhopecten yessoensis]
MHSIDPFDWTEGLESIAIYSSEKTLIQDKKTSKYVKTNIPGPGCDMDDFETQILGCKCENRLCIETCSCIAKYGTVYDDGKILLSVIDGKNMVPIIECNTQCTCTADCQNRLIQNGISFKMEVFRSETKGLGLRTIESIDPGSFVCEYAGEILSFEEAKQRTKRQTEHDMNYVIVVKEHHRTGVMETYVDPSCRGNIGRYINHSCSPNLSMVPVRVNSMVPKLCLFAVKEIPSLTELTFDYGHASSTTNSGSVGPPTSSKQCMCGAHDCRGYLPYERLLYE